VATSSTAELLKVPGWGSVAVLNCNASFANVGLTKDGSDASLLWMETTVAKPGAMVIFEVHGGWAGSGCAFAVTASEYVG
jgi:hypothetical protein